MDRKNITPGKLDMRNYIKTYLNYFGYGEDDFIPCERCGAKVEGPPHHIEPRGMGGSKNRDNIEDLIGLCNDCHLRAEGLVRPKITKAELKKIVRSRK